MTDTRVSDAELAALIAGLAPATPPAIEPEPPVTEAQAIELLVSTMGAEVIEPAQRTPIRDAHTAACEGCGTVMFAAAARYAKCATCALKGTGDDLFGPAAPVATTQTAPEPKRAPEIAGQAPGPITTAFDHPDAGRDLPVYSDDEPVTWDPPTSTVAEMRDVLSDLDASRPRSQQVALGPSELGTPCQRQMAMKLAGLPRQPDRRPPWAPMQGTAMHTLMEEALRFHNGQLGRPRWVIEEQLQIDPEIGGHGDAYDADQAMVVDWKYTGSTALKKVKRKTVPVDQLVSPDYRVQAHLYGLGHANAGRPVRWVRLVLLARSHDYDESAEWTEAYQPDIAFTALTRYYATHDLIKALDVANNPSLWPAVPAVASEGTCQWCPFRRPGGPADATGCPGNTAEKADKQLAGLIA